MNRVLKAILIALAGLVAIVAVAAIGVNLYVQSPGTQARIQAELSKALRIPLEITNTTITPWGGLRITGVTIPSGSDRSFLDADAFTARYRVGPLLKGRLVIYRMVLDQPKIVWAPNADGKWVLPTLPKTKGEKKDKSNEPKEKRKEKSKVVVEGLEVRNATIELFDAEGNRLALGNDVSLTWSFANPQDVEGTFDAARLAWKDALVFTEVHTPLRYQAGTLTFSELRAMLAGGPVQGRLSVETEAKRAPFALTLAFEKIDFARLTTEAGWQPGQAAGILSGTVDLRGNSDEIARLQGTGDLALESGQFRQLEFFQTIGQVLQIEQLSNLRLKSASAKFHLSDEKTWIDRVALETPDLQLSAKGVARFDGKLQLDAQLAVADRLARQLPGFVRDNFNPPNSDGWRAIDFKISGRTDKPKYDLLDRIVGQRIGAQFDDLVSSLFGGSKKKKDEEKKDKKKKADPAKPVTEPHGEAAAAGVPKTAEP